VIVAVVMVGWPHTPNGNATSATTVYTTTTGQRATVRLADGSRVTLAPRSRLTLEAGFGPAHRTVALAGEAMFEVEHAGAAPFVVNTGDVRTRVLGTSFDVRRYADDRDVRVAVRDGKVSVASKTHRSVSATLSAGELARITDSTAITASGDMAPYTEWTHGRLEFSNTPLPEVLATVGRWYGYQFRLADSTLAMERLTATFDYTSRTDAVQALRVLLNASIAVETRGADTVVILRRQAGARSTAPVRSRHLTIFSIPMEVGR